MSHTDPFTAALQEWVEVTMRRSMRNVMRYIKESGLSMSQMGALFHLHRQGSCGVSDLGEHLSVTSAAASQLLDRLVEQGLILRSEDPQDRRLKQVVLTEQGMRVIHESLLARQGWLGELTASLSAEEKEGLLPALQLLVERAKQHSLAAEEAREMPG
jgi:DNA-binding MarR family transcriptional regulator